MTKAVISSSGVPVGQGGGVELGHAQPLAQVVRPPERLLEEDLLVEHHGDQQGQRVGVDQLVDGDVTGDEQGALHAPEPTSTADGGGVGAMRGDRVASRLAGDQRWVLVSTQADGDIPMKEQTQMGIGAGIFLIAVGAILTFALKDNDIAGIDLPVVGVILMLCGVAGIILDLVIFAPRRRGGVRDAAVDPAYGSRTVVERERY